ncbi:unnamed protein product [Soboliphyme baturini]|uniref:Uncharacterized protein n=1 Tax=Soboliphyme baturini TaxID=241478 RepID=A0A183IE74_9BILA|nr:unnamed protein product [Soboliphyme baturini]
MVSTNELCSTVGRFKIERGSSVRFGRAMSKGMRLALIKSGEAEAEAATIVFQVLYFGRWFRFIATCMHFDRKIHLYQRRCQSHSFSDLEFPPVHFRSKQHIFL